MKEWGRATLDRVPAGLANGSPVQPSGGRSRPAYRFGVVGAALLFSLSALAAKPTPVNTPEGFETILTADAVVGLLVQLEGSPPDKAKTLAMLDGVFIQQRKLEPGEVGYSFFKTPKGYFVTFSLTPRVARDVKAANALALLLSKQPMVSQAIAWLHPSSRGIMLRGEAIWRFSHGQRQPPRLFQWSDDEAFRAWSNDELTDTQWAMRRGAQYPLTALATELGIPGRWFFEYKNELFALGHERWPTDVGDNLALVSVYLPKSLYVEIQQEAEAKKSSPSKVLQAALLRARTDKKLGQAPDEAMKMPWDEDAASSKRVKTVSVDFFFEREIFGNAFEAVKDDTTLTDVFSWAWRRSHPASGFQSSTKTRDAGVSHQGG